MHKQFEYFYDFSSPYAYLACEEVERIAQRTGATVVWRPFFLGGLFKALGSSLVPIQEASPAKRAWLSRDIDRWGEWREIAIKWPSRFPMNTIRALRVVLQLEGEPHAAAAKAIFHAYWEHDRDINDAAVLIEILNAAGLDGEALLAGTQEAEVKQRLFTNTDELLERGGCGAPAFFVGDLHFWGQDRLEMVEKAIDGWQPAAG